LLSLYSFSFCFFSDLEGIATVILIIKNSAIKKKRQKEKRPDNIPADKYEFSKSPIIMPKTKDTTEMALKNLNILQHTYNCPLKL
jgi:hypothetical protein